MQYHLETVKFDGIFWEMCENKCSSFFTNVILLELTGKFIRNSRNALSDSAFDTEHDYCQQTNKL